MFHELSLYYNYRHEEESKKWTNTYTCGFPIKVWTDVVIIFVMYSHSVCCTCSKVWTELLQNYNHCIYN